MTFEELVDVLHDGGSTFENGHPQTHETLAVQLRHTHLPKLTEYGVIELDHRNGDVRYHPDEQVETLLDSLPGGVSVASP